MKTTSLIAAAAMAALTIATPAFAKSAPGSSAVDFTVSGSPDIRPYVQLRAQDGVPQYLLDTSFLQLTPSNGSGMFGYVNDPSSQVSGDVNGFVGFYTRTADMDTAPTFTQHVDDFLNFGDGKQDSFGYDFSVDSVATDLSDFDAGKIDLTLTGSVSLVELALLPPAAMPATLTIHLTRNGDDSWAMAGTLDVPTTTTAAVPEPASWAMMVGGFGLVGGALRSRRRNTAITFA